MEAKATIGAALAIVAFCLSMEGDATPLPSFPVDSAPDPCIAALHACAHNVRRRLENRLITNQHKFVSTGPQVGTRTTALAIDGAQGAGTP